MQPPNAPSRFEPLCYLVLYRVYFLMCARHFRTYIYLLLLQSYSLLQLQLGFYVTV